MPKISMIALFILALVLAAGGAAYWHFAQSTATQPDISTDQLAHFEVFLQHKPCVNQCPAYAVLARGDDNTMTYVGVANVATVKTLKLDINDAQLRTLYRATHKAQFLSVPDIYQNDSDGVCHTLDRNHTRIVIGVTKGDQTHVIHYDIDCKAAPAKLKALVHTIDSTLNVGTLTGLDASITGQD